MPTYKPDLTRLSVNQLATLAGVKHETARRRLRDAGLEPAARDGTALYFDPRAALPIVLGRPALGGELLDLAQERARLARAQAEARELKNDEARRELIPVGELEEALVELASATVLRLDAMPVRAAPELGAARTDAEREAVLRRHLNEALDALADLASGDAGGAQNGPGDVPEAAGADGGRVGRRRAKA